MRLTPTPLGGAWLIECEPLVDARGHFARTYDRVEWVARGMDPSIAQCSVSFNARAGTLRGMHLQVEPHGESKLIRVTRGAIFDVLVDVRPDSPTHLHWFGVQLNATDGRELFAPPGLAHGFQTLEDATEVGYQISTPYVPTASTGLRWDDPTLGISWPDPPARGRTISQRDLDWPLISAA
jgi:dTDP-4-dehydrorhamnose 3,5-epimerase